MSGGNKEHVERIRKSDFNRQRNDGALRSNCNGDGYVFTDSAGTSGVQCQIHHVLPVTSLQDGNITVETAEERKFIRNCMAMTKWDCNEQPNLIGLPTKSPYEDADRKLGDGKTLEFLKGLSAALGNHGALPDLPCHLNEHDKYTAELITTLNDDLWSHLVAEREPCTVKGKDIKQLLEDLSKDWKGWLKKRGGEEGGAAQCWVDRETKERWYIPFSMAPIPKKIDAPPRYMRKGGKEWRAKLFSFLAA